MTEYFPNAAAGRWSGGFRMDMPRRAPMPGAGVVDADAAGPNLPAALAFARMSGSAALRSALHLLHMRRRCTAARSA